jgi:hypothetical protein
MLILDEIIAKLQSPLWRGNFKSELCIDTGLTTIVHIEKCPLSEHLRHFGGTRLGEP